MAKSSARMRKAKRTGAFIETTHLDCFQRAERGGCERCGPRACAKFTVVHTADEATDPSVMAFCSICGKCVYFFYFCTGSMCMGNYRIYLTPCFVLFVRRVRLQVAPAHGSVAAGDGRGGTGGPREVPARQSREGRGAGEGDEGGVGGGRVGSSRTYRTRARH